MQAAAKPYELYPGILVERRIECFDGTIFLASVRYGKRNRAICPEPSSLIIQADEAYCNSTANYFKELENR
jgi:hypothetical protein